MGTKKRSREETMTQALRRALEESESLRQVERDTGLKRQSLMKFKRGEQSLRLDLADKLAKYFGLSVVKKRR